MKRSLLIAAIVFAASPALFAAASTASAQATPAAAGPPAAPAAGGGRVKASPVARVMAQAHGIDLSLIAGTGPGGRVVRADVLKAIEKGVSAKAAPGPGAAAGELLSTAQEIPIAGVRKVIFKNMHLSLATQAQLTLHTEASAEAMTRLRNRLNAAGAKVSYNALLVKVIAQALKQHPLVNAGVEGEVIKVWRQVHVGVAMDLGRGLIVPKVRNAESKSIREISADIDRLVGWVRASPPAVPGGEVLMPGEVERRARAQRLANGISLDPNTLSQIREAARMVGVPDAEIERGLAAI